MLPRLQRASRVRPLFLALAVCAWLGAWTAPAHSAGKITRIEARRVARGAVIAILAPETQGLEISSFTLANPLRLIFDLKDAALALPLLSAPPLELPGLGQARLGQFQSGPDVTRIVLDLEGRSSPPSWKVMRGSRPDETLILLEQSGPPTLSTPTLARDGDNLVLRLAGTGALTRRTAALDNPPRVFTDFANAELEVNFRKSFSSGPVREIRMAQQPPDGDTPVARLVVELRAPQRFSTTVEGEDLLISFGPPSARGAGKALAGKRIVVDPGHGGSDPGAVWKDEAGEEMVFEKDVALTLGLQLAELLKSAGAEVTLTRDQDTYLAKPSLRAKLANECEADALISLHCNSCSAPNALRGTMTLYHRPDSLALAQAVQEELLEAWGTLDKGVRFRDDLTLLKRTNCPSIIIETAFLNHDDDRALLLDPEMQDKGARAIARGVIRFFSQSSSSGATE